MNIFTRLKANRVEGFHANDLEDILNERGNENLPSIDTIVFDTILLDNGQKIKCIKNYYALKDKSVPKKNKANNTCMAVQKFYQVRCRPYDCVSCHKNMLNQKRNKQVISR